MTVTAGGPFSLLSTSTLHSWTITVRGVLTKCLQELDSQLVAAVHALKFGGELNAPLQDSAEKMRGWPFLGLSLLSLGEKLLSDQASFPFLKAHVLLPF